MSSPGYAARAILDSLEYSRVIIDDAHCICLRGQECGDAEIGICAGRPSTPEPIEFMKISKVLARHAENNPSNNKV